MSIQNPVPKLYKSIIDDVISSCKDLFLDDGLDEHVLADLQHIWELKLNHSKAVDNMIQEPEHIISTQFALAQQQAQQQAAKIAAAAFVLQNNALYQQTLLNQNFQANAAFNIPQQLYQHFQSVLGNPSLYNSLQNDSSTNLAQSTNRGKQNNVHQIDGNFDNKIVFQTQDIQYIEATNNRPINKSKKIFQLDGKYDEEEDEYDDHNKQSIGLYGSTGGLSSLKNNYNNKGIPSTLIIQKNPVGRPKGSTKKLLTNKRGVEEIDNSSLNVPKRRGPKKKNQNDSHVPEPSNSSIKQSKDEWADDDDEEENDEEKCGIESAVYGAEDDDISGSVGTSFARDIHEGNNSEAELDEDDYYDNDIENIPSASSVSNHEQPLNSEDDVSEEDPIELFDTDNVIVCQFEKITRTRNKWKFYFKDGIMNINSRDYVFQKALGEAEW